jgi:ArsR family transcriptional regulator, arsenate/arsenite/antimonite-responsive transcriptional repressor
MTVPPGPAASVPACAAAPVVELPSLDVALLRLLADPLRARIVQLLAAEQLCTCHLVELTGAKQTNISNHLRALREAGLVRAEPCGRFTYYRLDPDALAALCGALTALADAARSAPERRRPC